MSQQPDAVLYHFDQPGSAFAEHVAKIKYNVQRALANTASLFDPWVDGVCVWNWVYISFANRVCLYGTLWNLHVAFFLPK